MTIFKKKIFFFIFVLILCSSYIISSLSKSLLSCVEKYGEYGCENLVVKLTNELISETVSDDIKEELVDYENEYDILNFNVYALNSIAINIVNKLLFYFQKMENGSLDESFLYEVGLLDDYKSTGKGIVYLLPLSVVFNNPLISSLGYTVPIRYKTIGKVEKNIISEVEEYGINNALIKINLELFFSIKIIAPIFAGDKKIKISAPLVIKVLQGDIPDVLYGSNIIGGV